MIFGKKRFVLSMDNLTLDIGKGETILKALERHGTKPPFFCEGGACGVCCLYLRNGTVRDTRDDAIIESRNRDILITACVAKALSDITITYTNNSDPNDEEIGRV